MVTVRAVAFGGAAPIHYGVGQGDDTVDVRELVFPGGWIVKQLQLKPSTAISSQEVHVIAEDSTGTRAELVVPIRRSRQD